MANVFLKHNAFSGKTQCIIDNREVELQDCWGNSKDLSRLQDWVGKFFDELHKHENDDEYKIEFLGLPSDCADIENSFKIFKGKHSEIKIEISFKESQSAENRIEDLRLLFEKMQAESPYDDLKTEDVKNNFNKALGKDEDIGVVATMSSGKSTLINAMLGQELLPARNEATTAIVAKITDNDNQKDFTVTVSDISGEVICKDEPASLSLLEKYNSDPEVSVISITGDIPYINERGLRVVLNDTPGPNNSATEEHKKHTYDLLNADYKPMILYVFNASQLQTNDDNTLLNTVATKINAPDSQSRDRFIFVLNKVDQLDIQKGETVEKAIEDLSNYLEKHNIYNPLIIPVSAYLSKVIRMYKSGKELSEDEEDFLESKIKRILKDERRQFCNFANLNEGTKKKLNDKIEKAKKSGDEYELADLYSGLPALEIAINEYIEKYAVTTKINKAVESFSHIVDKLEVKGKSQKLISENEDARKMVIEKLNNIEKKLQSGNKGLDVKNEIKNLSIDSLIDDRLNEIKMDVIKKLPKKKNQEEIEKEEAIAELASFNLAMERQTPKFRSDAETAINESVVIVAKNIINEYKKKVKDIVKVDAFEQSDISVQSLIMPAINDTTLIDRFTETREVVVGTILVKNENKKWYKPWTWLEPSEVEENKWGKKEFVRCKEFHDAMIGNVLEQLDEQLISIKECAEEKTEEFKSFFEGEIDKLEKVMADAIKEQKSRLADKEKYSKYIEEEQTKLKWLENFNERLNEVLKI